MIKLYPPSIITTYIFDSNYEAFIVYVATFNISFDVSDEVHLSQKA